MSMSLTKDDLQAIKRLIDTSCGNLEARLTKRMDNIQNVVDRMDRVLQIEVDRNNRQDSAINKIRKALHST